MTLLKYNSRAFNKPVAITFTLLMTGFRRNLAKKEKVKTGIYSIGVDQSRNKVSIRVKDKAVKETAVMEMNRFNISNDVIVYYLMNTTQNLHDFLYSYLL